MYMINVGSFFFFSHKTEEEISQPTEPNIPFLSFTLEIQVYVGPQLLAGRADQRSFLSVQ